jgi:ribosomal-protein-alanine N-acetyltransferase
MSAVLRDDRLLLPMTTRQLDAVHAVEAAAYAFPWSRGNFIDSLAAGYPAQVLYGSRGELLGYFVAMAGVDEMHLLNITVTPSCARPRPRSVPAWRTGAPVPAGTGRAAWLEVARATHGRAHVTALRLQRGRRAQGYYSAPLRERPRNAV